MAVARRQSAVPYIGTAAEMAAMSGMITGDVFFQTDTGLEFMYGGSAWVQRNNETNIQVGGADVSNSVPVPTRSVLGVSAVGTDTTHSWLASALVNTLKSMDITKPTTVKSKYSVMFSNPSLITDLTGKIYNLQTLWNGETRAVLVGAVTIEKSTGAVIEDCEDAWDESDPQGANATQSTDAADFKVGTKAATFDLGADCPAGIIATEAISSTNMTGYTHVVMWVKSSVALAAGDFQILLDDTANCASPLESLNIPALSADTWTRVYMPLANPASDLAVISIGLKQIVDKGACKLWIDNVQAITMTTKQYVLENQLFLDGNSRITLSNDTVLGAGDAFSSIVRVLEVG